MKNFINILILTFFYQLRYKMKFRDFIEGKMIRKIFFIFLVLFACNIKTSAASVSSIMLDAKTGEVMYEENANIKRYPASLTKLMTLYITFNALENNRISLDDELKISHTAANRSPSRLGLTPGKTIKVKDAIMAVIVKSANDCATVLAEHFSKTEADFANLMTSTAKKLGMNNTIFKNASGLPNSKQKTTAKDMAILGLAIYHHFPQYYEWFSVRSFEYNGNKIYGHNDLLKNFEGTDGLKTGYTAAAGYNIVTSAQRNGNRVIAVTMGHPFQKERDKKIAFMMEKGLSYMQLSPKFDVSAIKEEMMLGKKNKYRMASLNKKIYPAVRPEYKAGISINDEANIVEAKEATTDLNNFAKIDNKINNAVIKNGKYAIQIGSFSDYQRAKSYAVKIKQKLAKKYAVYNIAVEKALSKNKTIYRSKVTGLAQNDAKKICREMKKNRQSCLVLVDNNNLKLAQNDGRNAGNSYQ